LSEPAPTVGEAITERLRTAILTGRYRPGDRLPSERELSLRFEASRGAVREALKRLQQLGLADIQPGGARVRPLHEASLEVVGHLLELYGTDAELLGQVHEVFASLMDLAARALCDRASDAEIADLRALTVRLREPDLTPARRLETRLQLGHAMLEASHNLVLQLIGHGLRMQVHPHLHERLDVLGAAPDAEALAALEAALAARDPAEVSRRLRRLMDATHETVVRAIHDAEAGTVPAPGPRDAHPAVPPRNDGGASAAHRLQNGERS
jgi:GntR family transcriptional repressor for pyruvate dehydrogenase complex